MEAVAAVWKREPADASSLDERADLEAMTARTTMSRFVRNLLRQEGIGCE
jgi:hypothetical protein